MRLQTQLLLTVGVVMGVAFAGLELFSHQRIQADVEQEMRILAEQIRGVLMSTRRVYHRQFQESGIPLNASTIGFLPAHAMNRISKEFSNWALSGISFNNVSDSPRNPENRADAVEMAAIRHFREYPDTASRTSDYIASDGTPYRHFAWPIWVEKYCLDCHGSPDAAPAAIREQYDTGFGYKEGDLRGIMSIKIPATALATRVREDFLQNFVWHLGGFVALLVGLGLLLRRQVIFPLERLRASLATVEQGGYDVELSGMKGEFGQAQSAFNHMVQAIRTHAEALRASHERFRSVTVSVADAILAINSQGDILFWNRGAQAIFGYAEEEILGAPVTRLIPAHMRMLHQQRMSQQCHEGEGHFPGRIMELEGVRRNGEVFPLEISLSCWREEGALFFSAVIRDISSRKEAEEALQRAHQEVRLNDLRLRSILDNTPAVVFLKDVEGRFILINRRHEELFHLSNQAVQGKTDHEIFPRTMADTFRENDRRVLASGVPWIGEEDAVQEDGVHTYHVIKFPLRDETGAITGLCGIATDITERKGIEKALADLLELNRKIVTESPSGIIVYRADGPCVLANPAAASSIGATVEQVLAQNFRENPKWKQYGLLDAALTALEHGSTVHMDGYVTTSFGKEVWLEYHFAPFTSNGEPHLLLLIGDITQKQRAESALRESEEKFRSIFDHAGDGILVANPVTRRFAMANATISRMLGYTVEELVNMAVDDIHPPEALDFVHREFQRIAFSGGVNHDIPVRRKDGTLFRAEITADPILLNGQRHILGMFRDITERLHLEEQLRQSRKLQAVGALSGGIAHNFNNILAVILGNAELAQMGIGNIEESLADITESAKRGRDLVRQLLAFSRRVPMSSKPFAPGPVVREAVQFMRSALPPTVQIQEEVAELDGVVLGDATQFQQIVLNLVTNAGHALGDAGGSIRVALDTVRLTPAEAVGVRMAPGEYYRLEVQDHGPGMTPEVRERIFEPFFTTKEPGQGTGLGLSMVHGVVMELHGAVVCESAPGEGALFRIWVPRLLHVVQGESAIREAGGRETSGGGRVLFVDDESSLVQMGLKMLRLLGYEGRGCVNPEEALELFRADPESFVVVITDQVMPEMSGVELAERIHQVRPEVPVFLCTGFSESITEENALAQGVQTFFMKPVTMQELARALAEVGRGGPEVVS